MKVSIVARTILIMVVSVGVLVAGCSSGRSPTRPIADEIRSSTRSASRKTREIVEKVTDRIHALDKRH